MPEFQDRLGRLRRSWGQGCVVGVGAVQLDGVVAHAKCIGFVHAKKGGQAAGANALDAHAAPRRVVCLRHTCKKPAPPARPHDCPSNPCTHLGTVSSVSMSSGQMTSTSEVLASLKMGASFSGGQM